MMTATAAPRSEGIVRRIFPGETMVILGGGPSLTVEDVNYVRGKAPVIAIKEAAVCAIPGKTAPAPWAEVLYACDAKFWDWHKGAPLFTGLKYALEPQPGMWPDVHVLRNTGREGLELDPTGLRTGQNSGMQAVNLAFHLGAARIILLGFDMWRNEAGEQNWFGNHPLHQHSPYAIFLHYFGTIVEPLKEAGIEVINCSRQTQLTAFPRASLMEVL